MGWTKVWYAAKERGSATVLRPFSTTLKRSFGARNGTNDAGERPSPMFCTETTKVRTRFFVPSQAASWGSGERPFRRSRTKPSLSSSVGSETGGALGSVVGAGAVAAGGAGVAAGGAGRRKTK